MHFGPRILQGQGGTQAQAPALGQIVDGTAELKLEIAASPDEHAPIVDAEQALLVVRQQGRRPQDVGRKALAYRFGFVPASQAQVSDAPEKERDLDVLFVAAQNCADIFNGVD